MAAVNNQLNLWPSVAEVNFELKQTLTCQNICETILRLRVTNAGFQS